jgi:hypothetical protein
MINIMLLRFLGWGSFAALFLLISPKLRMQLLGCIDSGVQTMDANSPWSYIGGAVLLIVIFLYSLVKGAQPS